MNPLQVFPCLLYRRPNRLSLWVLSCLINCWLMQSGSVSSISQQSTSASQQQSTSARDHAVASLFDFSSVCHRWLSLLSSLSSQLSFSAAQLPTQSMLVPLGSQQSVSASQPSTQAQAGVKINNLFLTLSMIRMMNCWLLICLSSIWLINLKPLVCLPKRRKLSYYRDKLWIIVFTCTLCLHVNVDSIWLCLHSNCAYMYMLTNFAYVHVVLNLHVSTICIN
jgi:hypothetical protein